MLDNALIQLFVPIIEAGLLAAGYTTVGVDAANQPTQQGVPTLPTVFYTKISDHRYGFLGRKDVWVNPDMVHTEMQIYETTFQISALVIQDPTTISFTASDLVNTVAQIMQSDKTRTTLLAAGVGILRVEEIRNPYFVDDKDRFEASPSFDFVLTHKQIATDITPVVESLVPGIYPVL